MATPASAFQDKNAAPIDPLLRLKDGAKLPSNKITDGLKKKFQYYWNKDSSAWREIINVGVQVEMFFAGKQFPIRNPLDGSYSLLPITGMSNSNTQRAALNIMHSYYANLEAKWLSSNPDILVRPGRNLDQCAIAAKGGQVVWNYYGPKYYDAWYSRQECRAGTTFGTYINRVYFDNSVQSMSVLKDVFETKNVQMGKGIGICPECQFVGPASVFQQNPEGVENFGGNVGVCPECQGMAQVEQPAGGEFQSVSGQKEDAKGDLVCVQMPLAATRFDLMKRAEDSSYLIHRQEIPSGAVRRVLGNVKIPGEAGNSIDGLGVVRALGTSGQAIGGFAGYGNWEEIQKHTGERVSFDEMWLSADDISDINLTGGEETIDGDTLPQGKLSDVFPDGLCAVGLNGMAVILGLYSEKHRDHVSSGVWFVRGLSGAGRGLADAVEVQKQFNRFANQQATYHDTIATPAIGVDSQILPPGKAKYLGTSNLNIPFDMTRLPEGRTMKDALWQFQAAPFPAAAIQYYQQMLNVVGQKATNVTDFNNGEPGITGTNTTATAAEIDQSNADAINQPIFQGKSGVRKRNAEITLKLYPQYFPEKRFLQLAGKRGEEEGKWLYGSDLKADLKCEVITNSEMPKGPFTQRKNMNALAASFGGFPGLFMAMTQQPKETAVVLRAYDVDMDFDEFDDVETICRKRLDQIKQAAQTGIDDPFALIMSIDPPIDEAELYLDQKAKWFAAILDTDEIQDAGMPVRQTCSLLAKGQILGQLKQQAMLALGAGAVETIGQAPQALAEQSMQPEPEEPQASPDAQMKLEADARSQAMQSTESQKQRDHESSESDKERKSKVELEKIKAKSKSKASKK